MILAIAALFLLKDDTGRPLLSWDSIKIPELTALPLPDIKASINGISQQISDISPNKKGAEVTAYKWQDSNGIWHYSDKLNNNIDTKIISIDPDANLVHFKQPGKNQHKSQVALDKQLFSENSTSTWASPLSKTVDLMNKAKGVDQLAQERYDQQNQLIEEQSN